MISGCCMRLGMFFLPQWVQYTPLHIAILIKVLLSFRSCYRLRWARFPTAGGGRRTHAGHLRLMTAGILVGLANMNFLRSSYWLWNCLCLPAVSLEPCVYLLQRAWLCAGPDMSRQAAAALFVSIIYWIGSGAGTTKLVACQSVGFMRPCCRA